MSSRKQLKPYAIVLTLLIYFVMAGLSSLAVIDGFQSFAIWTMGGKIDFGYHNFYWVFSIVILVVAHQVFLDSNLKENNITVIMLMIMFVTMTVICHVTDFVDDYLLKIPVLLVCLVLISSTILNNTSFKRYGRRCQIVAFNDLADKNVIDLIHTITFAVGMGTVYAIV